MSLSDRKKRQLRKDKKQDLELIEETRKYLIDKMTKYKEGIGKPLTAKEIDSLIKIMNIREQIEKDLVIETEGEVLPEGKLKQWIENHFRLTKLVFGEDNKRSKLTKEVCDGIFDEMGYYRCVGCGNLHEKSRECVFVEYSKFKEKEVDKDIDKNDNE